MTTDHQISMTQTVIRALDNIQPNLPDSNVLRSIQRALDQLRVIHHADTLTFYVKDPWTQSFELRHLGGIRKKEFMWDRPYHGSVFKHMDEWLAEEDRECAHY